MVSLMWVVVMMMVEVMLMGDPQRCKKRQMRQIYLCYFFSWC